MGVLSSSRRGRMKGCPDIPPCGTETARSTNAVNANSANDLMVAREGILSIAAARSDNDKRVSVELRLNNHNDHKHKGFVASYIRPPTAATHLVPWSDKGSTRSRYFASRRSGNEQSEQLFGSVRSKVTNCPRPGPPLILWFPPSGNDLSAVAFFVGPHTLGEW